MNPKDPGQMQTLARDLGISTDNSTSMQSAMRILYGSETIGSQRIDLLDLFREIQYVGNNLKKTMGRNPTSWELVSTTVSAASASIDTPHLSGLLRAYRGIEDANLEESLSAEARLADQVYKLSARLCVDGCQACLHTGSGLMPSSLTEATVSRTLLERFVKSS